MRRNGLRSVCSILLAVVMMMTTMFSSLVGLTVKAENEIAIKLSLKTVNATNNNWEFTPTVTTGNELATGWYKVTSTVDGTARESLIEYATYGDGSKHLLIYGHCFNASALNTKFAPTTSFDIAKDVVLTPVVANSWAEDTSRNEYKLTQGFSANYNTTNSAWEEVVQTTDLTISLLQIKASSNDWEFTPSVATGNELALGWYKLAATVDGETKDVLMEYATYGDGSKHLFIYGHCFHATPTNGKYPKTSLRIAKDAVLTPVVANSWSTEDISRNKYKLSRAFEANYNATSSTWEEVVQTTDLTISLLQVKASSNDWEFTPSVATGNELALGWYKLAATVDGETKDVLMEYATYGDGSKHLFIYGHCFHATPTNGKYPKTSLKIAKDAVLTPVIANSWSTEDVSRSKYKIAADFDAYYDENGSTWKEGTQPKSVINISLGFMSVDATNQNWKFSAAVAEGSELATGWYKATTTVDGEERQSLMEYAVLGNGSKQLYIYGHCFNASALNVKFAPATSLDISKDTVLTPVLANSWTEDASRNEYKLAEDFKAYYDANSSTWKEGTEPKPEIDISLALMTVDASNNNWKFIPTVTEGSELATGWYKVTATVDGETRDVLMEYAVLGNGSKQLYIYGHCFNATPTNNKYPKISFSIAKDATFIPVSANEWVTEDTTRDRYKLTKKFAANLNAEESVWEEEGKELEKTIISISKVASWSSETVFPIVIGNNSEISETRWHKAIDTANKGTWKRVQGMVNIDGTEKEITIDFPGNGEMFFNVSSNVQKMIIKADTVFRGTNGNFKINFDKNYEVYISEKAVYEEGKRPVPKDQLLMQLELLMVDNASNNWKFTSTVEAGSELEVGWYKVPATVDGVEKDVLMEYAVYANGSRQLYIYGHCFNPTPLSNTYPKTSFSIAKDAVCTPVIANNWGTVDAGRNSYKLTKKFVAKFNAEESVWEEEGKELEKTTISISKVASWSSETVFPILIGNNNNISKTRWHKAINTADKPTWKRVQGTVKIDGVDTVITIDFPGNGEMFFNVSSDKEKMIIKADTVFMGLNGNFRVQFDKNYEVYLSERLIFEEGKRPKEKKPIFMNLTFNKMTNGTFDFKYGSKVKGHPVAGQFYHATAIIDGVEKEILIESGAGSGLMYIYEHCFASAPNKNSTPPVSKLKFKAGTLFYPVDKTTWSKNIGAQTYTLEEEVSVILVDNVWMDETYYKQIVGVKPLEVEVRLDYAKGKVLRAEVVTASGKTIEEIYGDWTTAYGPVRRGILNAKGKYEFAEVPQAIYSLTKQYFYFDSLVLGDLDAVRILAGTIIYPADGCKSMRPMKIMNNFGIVRDENDKWMLDEKFTTDYAGLEFKEISTTVTGTNTGNQSSTTVTAGETADASITKTVKDAKDTNKGVILRKEVEEGRSVVLSMPSNNTIWIVAGGIIVILLCAGIVFFLLLKKRGKEKQEE